MALTMLENGARDLPKPANMARVFRWKIGSTPIAHDQKSQAMLFIDVIWARDREINRSLLSDALKLLGQETVGTNDRDMCRPLSRRIKRKSYTRAHFEAARVLTGKARRRFGSWRADWHDAFQISALGLSSSAQDLQAYSGAKRLDLASVGQDTGILRPLTNR